MIFDFYIKTLEKELVKNVTLLQVFAITWTLRKDAAKLALSSFLLSYFAWMFHSRTVNCIYLGANNSLCLQQKSTALQRNHYKIIYHIYTYIYIYIYIYMYIYIYIYIYIMIRTINNNLILFPLHYVSWELHPIFRWITVIIHFPIT